MSISSEITRISNAKTAIAESIANKGVTVPDGTKIDGMATLIDSIPTGGGGGNDEVYEITVTDDDIVYEPSDYAVDIDTSKINLSDEAYNYIKTNAPRFLKILNGTYIYYFVLSSDMSEETDRFIFYQGAIGGEGENFHLFYLNDDVDDPKCLIAYAGENPVIYSKIEDSVASTTKIAPVSGKAVYNAIQALFAYDETTKTLNITPIGGGS